MCGSLPCFFCMGRVGVKLGEVDMLDERWGIENLHAIGESSEDMSEKVLTFMQILCSQVADVRSPVVNVHPQVLNVRSPVVNINPDDAQ